MGLVRRLQVFASPASDNPHSSALDNLRSIGYHYDGKKTENGVTSHRLSYKMRRTPEHNARLINAMKQHGFTHEKIESGHKFTRPDAHMTALSKTGATRIIYSHRAEAT